jgi:hypothetical protein
MPPIIKLIQAIARLTQAGAIKKVEDAYKLAKRELGERFDEYKEIVKDAFNEGKRKQTIDKRTKDIKKDEEAGIKSLDKTIDVEDAGEGFIDFVRKTDPEGAAKMQKIEDEINKAIEEANKRVLKKEGKKRFFKGVEIKDPTFDDTLPFDSDAEKLAEIKMSNEAYEQQQALDRAGIKVDELSDDDPMGDLENILKGGPPREPTAKEMTERALAEITKKKSLGTMSQEAMIRSAVREFLERRVKDGSLTIPDKTDLDSIMQVRGNVDPIDIFRKAYGEDAIKGVSEIQDDFGDMLQGSGNFRELGDNFEKLFFRESDGGLRYNTDPKPVDQYGFDEGLMSLEEAERMLRKDLKEKQMLEDFDITDRTKNAVGGLAGILKL